MTPQKHVSPDQPWLMPEVIDWIDGNLLSPDMAVLETGSGGSTVWFSQRVQIVVSYEHDPAWAVTVRATLANESKAIRDRVDLRLRFQYPFVGFAPELRADEPFDLALIDGRGRVKSSIDAWQHLKPGGWLVLDDSRRERYAPVGTMLDPVCSARIEFRAAPWESEQSTTAWRKR